MEHASYPGQPPLPELASASVRESAWRCLPQAAFAAILDRAPRKRYQHPPLAASGIGNTLHPAHHH